MREASGPSGPINTGSIGPAGGPVPGGSASPPRASGSPASKPPGGAAGLTRPAYEIYHAPSSAHEATIPQHYEPGRAFGVSRSALSAGLQAAARGGVAATGWGALVLSLAPNWTASPAEDELRPSDARRMARLQDWLEYRPPEGVAAVDVGNDGYDVIIDGGSDYVPVLGRTPPDLISSGHDDLPDVDHVMPPPPISLPQGNSSGVWQGVNLPDVPTWRQAKMLQRLHAASLNIPSSEGHNPLANMWDRRITFHKTREGVAMRVRSVRQTSEVYQMKRRYRETKYGRRLVQLVYKVIGQTYGRYTEMMDAAEVAAWSTYARLPDGRVVPAMLVEGGDMKSVLLGYMNGRYRFDAYGFVVDYTLSQAGDFAASLSDMPLDMARRQAPNWIWSGSDSPAAYFDSDRGDWADVRISEEWSALRDGIRSSADPARVQRVSSLWS